MAKAKYPGGVLYRLRHHKDMSWGTLKKDIGMSINEMRYRINRYLQRKGKEYLEWNKERVRDSMTLIRKPIPDDWGGQSLYRWHHELDKTWGELAEASGLSKNEIQYRVNKYLQAKGRQMLRHEYIHRQREQQGQQRQRQREGKQGLLQRLLG